MVDMDACSESNLVLFAFANCASSQHSIMYVHGYTFHSSVFGGAIWNAVSLVQFVECVVWLYVGFSLKWYPWQIVEGFSTLEMYVYMYVKMLACLYIFIYLCFHFFLQVASRNQLFMYHRHCSVMLPDGQIVILGGGGNCFSFGTHLNITPLVLDISQCVEAVSWEGDCFHQLQSTAGWFGGWRKGGGDWSYFPSALTCSSSPLNVAMEIYKLLSLGETGTWFSEWNSATVKYPSNKLVVGHETPDERPPSMRDPPL